MMMRIGLLVAASMVTVLFAALGMWQLDRAAQKREILAEFDLRGKAPKINLNQAEGDNTAAMTGRRTTAVGGYTDATILLDNQVHQGSAGYLVYTAFDLDGRDHSVLVNRGWIRADADRSREPKFATPTTAQQLEGRLSPPPRGGLQLEGRDVIEHLADGIWRVQGIDFPALTATVGMDLLTTTVQLDSEAPHGFVRAWKPPGSDETRHLGYAFQWFALAVTVVVVTVIVSLGKRQPDGS